MSSNCSQKRQQSSSSHLEQQQSKLELIKLQVEQNRGQKEEELRHLQEKMQFLELEDERHQCGGESEQAIVDGSDVHDGAEDLDVGNNTFSGTESESGFMTPLVLKAGVREHFPNELQPLGPNDTNEYNRFDFSTLAVKAEQTF